MDNDTCEPNSGGPKTKPDIDDVVLHYGQRIVRSEELLRGERELIILHGSQVYRLTETRNGKLILQK